MKLLIVANVDAKGTPYNKRSDPNIRLSDTIVAINKWFKSNYFKSIIIVENSNNILKIKNKLIIPQNVEVEYLGYDGQSFPRQYGKGFGVYEAIRYALSNSMMLSLESDICVVPGRYYITNAKYILENLKCGFTTGMSNNLSYAFTPLLVARRDHFIKYIFPQFEQMDESQGKSYEHQLAKAVLIAISEGEKWELPIEVPLIDGVSGTSNERYYKSWIKTRLIRIYSRFKKLVFEYKI
jgi:hypothetical protein